MALRWLAVLGVLGSAVGFGSRALSCEAYWTEWPVRPEYIVIGKLQGITTDVFRTNLLEEPHPCDVIEIHNGGAVEIDEVLFGAPVGTQVRVAWHARSVCRDKDEAIYCSTEKHYEGGEELVWVVWPFRPGWGDSTAGYHRVQSYPVAKRKQIEGDIVRLLER